MVIQNTDSLVSAKRNLGFYGLQIIGNCVTIIIYLWIEEMHMSEIVKNEINQIYETARASIYYSVYHTLILKILRIKYGGVFSFGELRNGI